MAHRLRCNPSYRSNQLHSMAVSNCEAGVLQPHDTSWRTLAALSAAVASTSALVGLRFSSLSVTTQYARCNQQMAVHRLSTGQRDDLVHADVAAVSVHRPVGALPACRAMVPGARCSNANALRDRLLDRRPRTSAEWAIDHSLPPRVDMGNTRFPCALSTTDQFCVQAGPAAHSVLWLGTERA